MVEKTVREKRSWWGKSRKDEPPPAERTVCRALAWIEGINQLQVEQAHERESCFVLITNLMDAKKRPASSILGKCKQQSTVEARFSALKSLRPLGQIFLKKPSGVEAPGYMLC